MTEPPVEVLNMKCSSCGRICQKTDKFCSDCGTKLSLQSADSQGNEPKYLVADLEEATEKSQKLTKNPSGGPNDDSIGNSKKKKKTKRRNRKSKSGILPASDKEQFLASESQTLEIVMDSLQSGFSSLESLSTSSADSNTNPAQAAKVQTETTETRTTSKSEVISDERLAEESDAQKPGQDSAAPAQDSTSKDSTSLDASSGFGKGTVVSNNMSQTPERDNLKAKNEQVTSAQPLLDQNANVDPDLTQTIQTKQEGNSKGQNQMQASTAEERMVFAPHTPSKKKNKRRNRKSKSGILPASDKEQFLASESQTSEIVMDSLQSGFSSLESLSTSSADSNTNPAQAAKVQTETTETSTTSKSEVTSDERLAEESDAQKPGQDSAAPAQDSTSKDSTSLDASSGFGKGTVVSNNMSQTPERDNLKAKNEQVTSAQPFGSHTPSKAYAKDMGSSVDAVEHTEIQTSAAQTTDDAQSDPPLEAPHKMNTNITAKNRTTIYFHAVLSKDFNLDPDQDCVFIRAGSHIGTWDDNAVQLSVTRDLEEHGYLIEGSVETTKTDAVAVSIPYKYVVYKTKQKKDEFEYIYKADSKQHTNRCLFVIEHLLNQEGDWHQYDDIVCGEPPKGFNWRNVKNNVSSIFSRKKPLIQGREIAGKIMLDTIFEVLSTWTDVNLSSFLVQLKQFFGNYANPFVYEDKPMRWDSLDYGEDEVRKLMKEFMLTKVAPCLLKDGNDGNVETVYIKDPLRAAVIVLYVCREHAIKLDRTELCRLCIALCLPNLNRGGFLQYWEAFSRDVALLKRLPSMLLTHINAVKQHGNPHWIVVLPLLHLLEGSIKPFEIPTSENLKCDLSWAGLQGLRADTCREYTMNRQDMRAMSNLMKKHRHLMEVDALAVRSCLYLMSVSDLKEYSFNMNVQLLDILHVFTNKASREISFGNYEDVSDILEHIKENLLRKKYRCFSEDYAKSCLAVVSNLLEKICKGVKSTSANYFYTIPIVCMDVVASVFDFVASQETKGDGQLRNAKDLVMSKAMTTMRNWMSSCFKERLLSKGRPSWKIQSTEEMGVWNSIISINFKDEECTQEWRQKLSKDFEGKYKKESPEDQVDFYCTKMEKPDESLQHVAPTIERCALEAVSSVCQSKSEGKLFEKFKMDGKFMKLVSAILWNSWPRNNQGHCDDNEEVVLRHLLSWTSARHVLQLHGAEESLFENLTKDARDGITVAISTLTSIKNQFIQGNIAIKLLKIILERGDAFLDLLKLDCLSENEQHKDASKMGRLLHCRVAEVRAVYSEREKVDAMLTMIHSLDEHMTVDLKDMEQRRCIKIEEMPLDHFMQVHKFDQLSSTMAVVTFFQMDEDTRHMSEVLHKFRDSYLFNICWREQATLLANEEMEHSSSVEDEAAPKTLTLDVIHAEVFKPCFASYKDIYMRLKNGSIKIKEVDRLFSDYKGKYDELEKDLDIMCKVDMSTEKLWIHSRLQQIEQYHELHLAVASAQVIMEVKEALGLQGDFRVLETLTKVREADFQEEELQRIDNDLIETKKDLVDITESRRHCLKELGHRGLFVKWVQDVLTDLNELKVFVDLASISAGENDMEVDRVACFHDAVLGYASALYELQADSGFQAFRDVLKKLWRALDNDHNLPKKLRDSARHLEWLKTVKDSHGSVELSALSLASAINSKGVYRIGAQKGKKVSLDTTLELEIQEEAHEARYYSLEDVRELQNKLMLMSGKGGRGQREVNYFAEIFAGVQRLAESFIALYAAGNPLFRQWECEIHCCSSEEHSIMMYFNLAAVECTIESHLPELCRKMEKCLDLWLDFVDEQRSQHYYLNYFTAEQIVYLSNNLSQVEGVEDQVLMMLSFIKSSCTASDIQAVWQEFQKEILTKPQDFQTFAGVPSFELGTSDLHRELDSVSDLTEEINGLQSIDQIWNAYMKDMRHVLPHILNIKSLGRLLEILADLEDGRRNIFDQNFIIRRSPIGLAAGNPSLIVCPHEEVLTSCISIYMASEDEPLPTYDEVLLCNSSTTYEQVEIFLRRCLMAGSRDKKVYCLLYGDLLTYDVSCKVERFFQRKKVQCTKDYRLVILCSSEREHTYLPSAFSQYRLHIVPQQPLASIQGYLHRHYVVPAGQFSAAAAFKDRLCVGTVSSERAGVGKSLYIRRLYESLQHFFKKSSMMKCIRLIEPSVDEKAVLQSLLDTHAKKKLTVFHFDITSSVQKGIHEFLFKLLILRYLMDSEGNMWKCSDRHLYVIEFLEQTVKQSRDASGQMKTTNSSFTDVFPKIFCRPPKEVLMLEMKQQEDPNVRSENPLMDDKVFRSIAFQRPYQYLKRFYNSSNLDGFRYMIIEEPNKVRYRLAEGSHVECLQMLLMYCGINDPSWAELRNFSGFLSMQLADCERSHFCDADLTGDVLTGFKRFVVDFMIMMAKDFATPSLRISDQSLSRVEMDLTDGPDEDIAPFLIRKRWETKPHPYIFFNDDHMSMTFIGFHLKPNTQKSFDAVDPRSGTVIKENVMSQALFEGLQLQGVPFNTDFDSLPRSEKVQRICNVLGIQSPLDPDETYELTTDNILKILAIHMRFRCGIPVIIMGETGCGKTRLIKYLCELQRRDIAAENMKLVKVHGGTTSKMIYTKVREAEAMASVNKLDHGLDSVLFFDEANTTEDISSIKEVLCDKTVKGERLVPGTGLQIIAACNPYRKHTDEMIKRLESAGLGYRVRAEEAEEKLGSIPLRQLVYRVQALPPSMIPLVWDFGQLNDNTEKIYIEQIVKRVVESRNITQNYFKWITQALSASQKYMRARKDECSFVSLRDVERCMQSFVWFYDHHARFFAELKKFAHKQKWDKQEQDQRVPEDPILWSLVMALGVCYHACLEHKDKYRRSVSKSLPTGYGPEKIRQDITVMQDLLLSGVPMANTIARNGALKENVFMMVICIELRIPLFLVGKPGSSKSLSKTLVADAMQGQAAHSSLFKKLKQIHLVSFQCSPHSTPEAIIKTFRQCGRFQEGKNLDEYVSVVVLDEIGLAEDSPKMPLKILHPLLEEGCIDDKPLPHKKVGFIGISNWALDPAKMNRGIFVSRGDPDERELFESAKGICSSDVMVLEKVRKLFRPFASAYLKICGGQGKGFFGLRDYYSLIKMIYAVAKTAQRQPTYEEVIKAVLRNFSGKNDVDAVSVFTRSLPIASNLEKISAIEFVRDNIQAVGPEEECRYLLVLTKNYAALQILQQTFFSECGQPEIIFGSSFPKDQEYTQICRNINRVKICMETGQTVVLLNLQNLYESLYDALNQYYVYLGGQKYVDLGLGTHRVKCRVHKDFRLIVIEEREVVYKQFPIPLINRLEKHYLDIHTVLKTEQKRMVEELEKWVRRFVTVRSHYFDVNQSYEYLPSDVFIGYHSDTCASVTHQVLETQEDSLEISHDKVLNEAKLVLLRCATPDSVVRLDCTDLPKVETEELAQVYFEKQKNSCLADFICAHTRQEVHRLSAFAEVTTFSRLLTASELKLLEQMSQSVVELLSLQQFDTEQSFLKKIRNILTVDKRSRCGEPCNKVIIIQSDFSETPHGANLIASAKFSSMNEINKMTQESLGCRVFVCFITRLRRIEGGTSYVGFHGGHWTSVHIDDLRQSKEIVSDIKALQNMTICQLFETKMSPPEDMELEDLYEAHEEEAESRENQYEDDTTLVMDTTALVCSCVQSAVGMLRDREESGFRSTQRVDTLLKLLSDSDGVTGDFLQIVKKRLHSMLASASAFTSATGNWVIKVASNVDALQEGGTFRRTLWKRIQAVVVPNLAQLVSVIDTSHNLDVLMDGDCSDSVKRLWLDIFGDEKLLQIPQPMLNSKMTTILVRNYLIQGRDLSLSMPFSWRIKDYVEELWVHSLQNEGHTQQGFHEFFSMSPLGQHIAKATPEVFQRYLQDFVVLTMNVTCQKEVQLLCGALNSCINELHSQLPAADAVPSLPLVHAAYHQFKNRLQNLSRMVCLEPQVTDDLLSNPHLSSGVELVLDLYAALACLEYLEPRPLETVAEKQAWLRRVKKLKVPIELICSEDSVRRYQERSKTIVYTVQNVWNRIFSASLFVEHFEAVENEMTPFLLQYLRLLSQILANNSDLKTQHTFEAVIDLLKKCKNEAVQRIFGFDSLPWCLLCQGDPHHPVCLPCQHMFCGSCIKKWLIPCQMYCPHCKQSVADDFAVVPSEDLRIQIDQHVSFRNQCNSFFIDLVSLVCFKDNSPPCAAVIQHLLSFLMVQTSADQQIQTKVLSPFDDSADKNPVVRSVVLKLLLKYSFDEVKEHLQQHLLAVERCNILEEKDKIKLYCLYVNCMQDSMFERFEFRSDTDRHVCLRHESDFLREFLRSHNLCAERATVENLQQLARVRMDLDVAAAIVAAGGGQSKNDDFLEGVIRLCTRSGNNWYRVYLIRKICSQHGVEFAMKLLKMENMHWLFPEEVLQKSEEATSVDQYLLCGRSYKTIRDACAKAIAEGRMDDLDEICQGCTISAKRVRVYLLLALFREVTTLYRNTNASLHPKPERFQPLLHFIETSKVLANPQVRAFAEALVTNRLGPLAVSPGISGDDYMYVSLTVHLAAVLLCTDQTIVAPLQQLAMTPHSMQAAFLPTMPQNKLVDAMQALPGIKWYYCANGHPCTVGECGRPMEIIHCLDCGVLIGGRYHNLVENFKVVEEQGDRTQPGHILGDPSRRDNADMLDTNHLSPVSFTIIRMLTHMAMLVGASGRLQAITSIIRPPVKDPGPFLRAHLQKDVEHLVKCLRKGTDDAVGTVHLLLSSLLEPQQQQNLTHYQMLSSKEMRNDWELQMSNCIMAKLMHLDRRLKEMKLFIQTDSHSSNPIMRLCDNPGFFLASLPIDSPIHTSALWSCREKVSLLHLTHVVELSDGKDKLPVLWRFLNREAELRLVRHLPDILTLQKELVKKFQNLREMTCSTIMGFLHSLKAASLRAWYEKHISTFLTTWNQLRSSLATKGELKLPDEFCQKDLDTNSDLQVLLPQRQGFGLCSTALVSYLISLHNDMVYCVDRHMGEETRYKVSPVDLTDLHVIHYELERDVMPMVLSNTQYSIERGQDTLHEYDLPKIQMQVVSRFLLSKPLIYLDGIPTLVNRHERNYQTILKDVKEKVKQETLPALTVLDLARELHNYSEACEALSTLELALGFLAMAGGDPHMQLSSYLEDVLQMGNQISEHILKVLRQCSLKHCVALWQLLTSHKSETMLMLKKDAFRGVCQEYQQALGENERQLLTAFCYESSTDTFLLEMHEFLILEFKNPKAPATYRPSWTLKASLEAYMERKDLGFPPDLEKHFPDEICLCHSVETWKFINAIKQERRR
ncbi:E3 ubiquitin-protein ligase rnf213-alpha isoform X2 [Dunckerocampus dactyliophorus]|uniref:E3 ubiquitin-protein ligase rnf213-alpha isoform X2 n=1 Tax=Dunckerocampus dactyliophorus TaxID=161453 RepID=UPI0024068F86|nr:E3 ubiquitin-protein ligase rnf213-alpha isoform X2 [Dunckerocampus dactyliophorus]